MCMKDWDFKSRLEYAQLVSRTTVAANELFTVPCNGKRYGFVVASGGASINMRPTMFGTAVNAIIYTPGGPNPLPPLTIDYWGPLIFEKWDFTLVTLGNSYVVYEITLGATQWPDQNLQLPTLRT